MEHREAELAEVEPSDGSQDDPARFLRELCQLRIGAGLGHAELAARAHYPCEAVRAAEAGPALPALPVLSAYVRSCGGTVAEWEERWRTLTRSPALPLLSVRTAGCSDAAAAGARIGSASLAADGHDPALVMAALSRVASGITDAPVRPSPAQPPVAPAALAAPAALEPLPSALAAPVAPTAPAARAVPAARLAPRESVPPMPAAAGSQPPCEASAAPEPGSAAGTRRALPSRPLIAAIITLLCLTAAMLALFS